MDLKGQRAEKKEEGGNKEKGRKAAFSPLSTLTQRWFSKLGGIKCHFQNLTGIKGSHSGTHFLPIFTPLLPL
ncbi:MAG: hypothetical protein J6S25_03130 [Aeriscardovia sp.]|nr:hypothetical protein [Aeriscardovia sp.]